VDFGVVVDSDVDGDVDLAELQSIFVNIETTALSR
jgi:hypothetical protein